LHTSNSNYTWWGYFIPPPPMVLLCYTRLSSIPIGSRLSPRCTSVWIGPSIYHSALNNAFSVRPTPLWFGLLNPLLNLNFRRASISFQTIYLSHLSVLLTLDGLLCCIGALQSPLELLRLYLCPSISYCTPLLPSALPLPTSPITLGTTPFPMALLHFPQIHHITFQSPSWFTPS
jgi:hypothetical protein